MHKKCFRLLSLLLAVVMLFSLTACKKTNSGKKPVSSTGSSVSSDEKPDGTSDTADNSEPGDTDDIDDDYPDNPDDSYNPGDSDYPGHLDDPDKDPDIVDPGKNGDDDQWDPDKDIDYEDFVSPIKVYGTKVKAGSKDRLITVQTKKPVFKNFLSAGANVFAAYISDTGKALSGSNEVMFEVERKRFVSSKPRLNRMFLPVDYMITNTGSSQKDQQNWESGVYDFNCDRFRSVCTYIEMIGDFGGDVLLDYGWKVDRRIAEWFALSDTNLSGSAPRDLRSFAKGCAAAVEYLTVKKGYKNIPYLSFFNEMDHEGHDFDTLGDRRVYYLSMLKLVKKELKNRGLIDKIDMWVAEDGVPTGSAQYFQQHYDSQIQGYDFHHYPHDNGSGKGFYTYMHSVGEMLYGTFNHKPVSITEYGTGDYEKLATMGDKDGYGYRPWCWENTAASFVIAAANSGISGMCRWNYGTALWTSIAAGDYYAGAGEDAFWYATDSATNINKGALMNYYHNSIITNYVTQHSNVLQTDWQGSDVRVASFALADGNYTFVVEVNDASIERNITLKLDRNLNKTVYRMSSDLSQKKDANATVPKCDKTFKNVGSSFEDTVDKDYGLYVYTTLKPIKQIEFTSKNVAFSLNAGKSIKLAANMIDCDADDEIVYSVSSATNKAEKGTVSADGTYHASENAKSGDMVAVRASLKSNKLIYNVAVITIK